MRLDFDLDGAANTVQQVDVVAEPNSAPSNPFENAFHAQATPLKTEKQARAHLNLRNGAARGRSSTRASKNAVGEPVGYKFLPGDNAFPLASPERLVAEAGRLRRTITSG